MAASAARAGRPEAFLVEEERFWVMEDGGRALGSAEMAALGQ